MRLDCSGRPHLTYCTNIHPGETWSEVRANVERHVTRVKAAVAPTVPFGVGLRLSATAAAELAEGDAVARFAGWLAEHGLYVFTLNGFPYGPFHGQPVKESVYLPDWRDDLRLAYADRLAWLLARLLPPDDTEGSVSTVPGAFQARVRSAADVDAIADRLLRHVATLAEIRERTGRVIALALEPEPACLLETTADAIAFVEQHLFAGPAVARLAALTGRGTSESARLVRRHVGLCLDACHLAVAFERPAPALAAARTAGIRVAKIQLSTALVVPSGTFGPAVRDTLAAFADDVYLHQVVRTGRDGLVRFVDLPEALQATAGDPATGEWRIHFHVPVFRERLGAFTNTAADLAALLAVLRDEAHCPHLEVETYTWSVLPPAYRREDVAGAIARELDWVRAHLAP